MSTDLNIQQNKNIQAFSSQGTASVSVVDNTSTTIEMVDKNVVEGQGNIDVAETNNTSQTQQKTTRTEDELQKAVTPLLTKYGLALTRDEIIKLLERVAGSSKDVLLNISNSEIQKQLQCLEAAMKKLYKAGETMDLEALAELANDYNIAIHTGWTIEGFEKAQNNKKHESLKERLERVYPGKTTEEALELYFTAYFDAVIADKIKNAKTPEEIEEIKTTERRRQLQDFGRLLANSTDEEKELFRDAIKSLYAQNRLTGLESLFKSLDSQDARTELADSCDIEYLEETQAVDRFGETPSKEINTGITATIAQNQSETGRKEFHEDFQTKLENFYKENKSTIETINQKIQNGEELTPEEQAIKDKLDNFYKAVSAGEISGTAINTVISNEAKTEILTTINNDNYAISENYDKDFYREVLESVIEYVEKNPEKTPVSQTELVELLDKITNGNYTTVANDIKNNTVTDLAKPVAEQKTTTVQETKNETVTQKQSETKRESKAYDTTRLEELKRNLYNQQETQPQIIHTESILLNSEETELADFKGTNTGIASYLKFGSEGIKQFFKDNSRLKAINEVFGSMNKISSQTVINKALELYKNLDSNLQLTALMNSTNEGFNILLKNTKAIALVNNEGKILKNYYQTKQFNDKAEETRKDLA